VTLKIISRVIEATNYIQHEKKKKKKKPKPNKPRSGQEIIPFSDSLIFCFRYPFQEIVLQCSCVGGSYQETDFISSKKKKKKKKTGLKVDRLLSPEELKQDVSFWM
jgi:hypothetical protein